MIDVHGNICKFTLLFGYFPFGFQVRRRDMIWGQRIQTLKPLDRVDVDPGGFSSSTVDTTDASNMTHSCYY